MTIFISYGHNDYTELVNRVYDALKKAGHEPWKDDRFEREGGGIAAGQDFTDVIYQKMEEADFVIAFLTNCTMHKPYCRDERNYAYEHKKTRFIQIRLDRVKIQLGNAQSYVEMSDVVDSTGRIHQKLFDKAMESLFAALRDHKSFSEGGFTPWAKFEAHLKVPGVVKYDEFITSPEIDDFVGREWLLKKCKSWVMDDSISQRLFVIYGEAGTGKTAFVRHLAQDQELVRSVHICIYDRTSTRTAKDTLKDLSYVLAHRNESYYQALKNKNLEEIQNMSEDSLFEFLFLDPLKTEKQKYLLIIDGLDEMEQNSGLDALMRIFRQFSDRINPNISFLITTRPDEHITHHLNKIGKGRPLESATLSKESSQADLLTYIRHKLSQANASSDALEEKILDASDGNFAYLDLLFKEAQENGAQILQDNLLPRGLNERYSQYVERRFDMHRQSRMTKHQRTLLSLLCVAYEPLRLSFLSSVTNMDEYDVETEFAVFGSLIRRNGSNLEPLVSLFSKSFRDFLLNKDCPNCYANDAIGTEVFAEYIIENLQYEKDFERCSYSNHYGFVHLLHYVTKQPQRVIAYMKQLWDHDVDVALRIANALCIDTAHTVLGYWEIKDRVGAHAAILSHLNGKRAAEVLNEIAMLHKNENQAFDALILQADMLLWNPSPESAEQAEHLYTQALSLAEQETESNIFPNQTLSVAYEKLGACAWNHNTPESRKQALKWYLYALDSRKETYKNNPTFEHRKALSYLFEKLCNCIRHKKTAESREQAEQWALNAHELANQNYAERPCYESRRTLAVTLERLGNIAQAAGTPEAWMRAAEWYQQMHKLREQNHISNPCFESKQELSAACKRLGDVCREENTSESRIQAEKWYLQKLQLDEQNYRENPNFESRLELSIAYDRLGNIARKINTKEKLQQAEQWYLYMLGLRQENYKENPCYDSRHRLSVAYNRLADLWRRKNTPDDRNRAEELYLHMMMLAEENYINNPCHQSQHSLSVVYETLTKLFRQKNTPAGDQQAEQLQQRMLALNCELAPQT